MNKKILDFCREKGLLVDNEVLNLLSETQDLDSVKVVIEKIMAFTNKKIITRNTLFNEKIKVEQAISSLPNDLQLQFETFKVKLGLSIEISREIKSVAVNKKIIDEPASVKVISNHVSVDKKLEVKDFVNYFRQRFNTMKNFLLEHTELKNLTSIDKISGSRQGISVIGLVVDKSITKNKNIILEIEDLTGKTKVLVSQNKTELIEKAEEIALDSVIGFKVSGNREILFANDIIFPDTILPERKFSPKEELALFIGDLHLGSMRFMEDKFLKFLDYLNGDLAGTEEEIRKIKYLFIVGDLVAGVGNYPGQEYELKIGNLEEQFIHAAELLKKVPKHIQIIISPGNHDGIRIMEPQPMFDEKFAWALYELENVTIVANPSEVNIGACTGFSGFNVLLYHGFSYFYYTDNIFRLMKEKANHHPEIVMKYLLNQRHLAPTHASTQYFPGEDVHLIKNIPDIFVSGHMHKSAVSYYNNILVIAVSTWEDMSPYMEKVGSKPDFCKVPLLNLKTRAVKVLDFE